MRSISVTFLLACCLSLRLATAATPPTSAPVAVPYAADRPLLKTDFVRFDWTDAARKRDVPVKIYFPVDNAGPSPVILFSHGLGGTREGYEYLGRQWAAHGYVVVHLQHAGSDDSAWKGATRPADSMRRAISVENAVERARDAKFALDQLERLNRDEKWKGKLDLAHVAIAGHSFGAHTTMMLADQRSAAAGDTGLADARIRCAVALSPNVPVARPAAYGSIFAGVNVPVLYMTGTKDDSPLGGTTANQRRIPFDHTKRDAYLVTFTDADHMVFSGRLSQPRLGDDDVQRLVRIGTTAFFDANLKSDAKAEAWLDSDYKSLIGDKGVYERK